MDILLRVTLSVSLHAESFHLNMDSENSARALGDSLDHAKYMESAFPIESFLLVQQRNRKSNTNFHFLMEKEVTSYTFLELQKFVTNLLLGVRKNRCTISQLLREENLELSKRM